MMAYGIWWPHCVIDFRQANRYCIWEGSYDDLWRLLCLPLYCCIEGWLYGGWLTFFASSGRTLLLVTDSMQHALSFICSEYSSCDWWHVSDWWRWHNSLMSSALLLTIHCIRRRKKADILHSCDALLSNYRIVLFIDGRRFSDAIYWLCPYNCYSFHQYSVMKECVEGSHLKLCSDYQYLTHVLPSSIIIIIEEYIILPLFIRDAIFYCYCQILLVFVIPYYLSLWYGRVSS